MLKTYVVVEILKNTGIDLSLPWLLFILHGISALIHFYVRSYSNYTAE
jgi:hypothetical protein